MYIYYYTAVFLWNKKKVDKSRKEKHLIKYAGLSVTLTHSQFSNKYKFYNLYKFYMQFMQVIQLMNFKQVLQALKLTNMEHHVFLFWLHAKVEVVRKEGSR